jgi:ribose 1,5-bisphosphokinase
MINRLRSQLQPGSPLLIAHRYITRAPGTSCENHIALSEDEFHNRKQGGLFAMDWHANGCHYAVGSEIISWLDHGFSVLFNGSRQQLETAKALFGHRLQLIALEVKPEVLAQRLTQRGREDHQQIKDRLARSKRYQACLPDDCWRLDNNGSIDVTVSQLLAYLNQQTTAMGTL